MRYAITYLSCTTQALKPNKYSLPKRRCNLRERPCRREQNLRAHFCRNPDFTVFGHFKSICPCSVVARTTTQRTSRIGILILGDIVQKQEHACKIGLDGIICKRIDLPYRH